VWSGIWGSQLLAEISGKADPFEAFLTTGHTTTYCLKSEKPFCRTLGNAAIHGVRLRNWRATESYGDASEIPYVSNGTKGYTTTTAAAATYYYYYYYYW
jgi:hypothetical protein